MTEVYARLIYLHENGELEDGEHDIPLSDFGGNVPAVGDKLALFRRGPADFCEIVERVFEADTKTPYVNLIVRGIDGGKVAKLARFSR